MRISPFALATSLSPPTGVLPPSSPSLLSLLSLPLCLSFTLLAEPLSFHFLLGKPCTPVVSAFSCSLSPSLPVTSKYKRHACTAPRLTLSLALPPSLAVSHAFVYPHLAVLPSRPPTLPPPTPATFFLSVKAAFQMLISSRSKRETERRRDD